MFNKIKSVLIIAIFVYVGYLGWKTYQGRPLRKPSILTPGSDTAGGEVEGERDVLVDGPGPRKGSGSEAEENLSPLQKIHRELNQISSGLFTSLDLGANSKSDQLRSLWKRSESEFKQGRISEADAKVLSAVITKLNEISNERKLYSDRFEGLSQIKATSMRTGMSVKEKQKFAEKQLNRQWSDWVMVTQPGVRRMLNALSE